MCHVGPGSVQLWNDHSSVAEAGSNDPNLTNIFVHFCLMIDAASRHAELMQAHATRDIGFVWPVLPSLHDDREIRKLRPLQHQPVTGSLPHETT